MNISFEPHPNENIADVQRFLIDGTLAGYCGTKAGSPVCFIRTFSQDVVELVKQAVAEQAGEVSSVNQPPENEDIEGVLEDDISDEE